MVSLCLSSDFITFCGCTIVDGVESRWRQCRLPSFQHWSGFTVWTCLLDIPPYWADKRHLCSKLSFCYPGGPGSPVFVSVLACHLRHGWTWFCITSRVKRAFKLVHHDKVVHPTAPDYILVYFSFFVLWVRVCVVEWVCLVCWMCFIQLGGESLVVPWICQQFMTWNFVEVGDFWGGGMS